jgi:hypothetical protein
LQNPNYNKPLSAITLCNRVNAIKNSIEFNDVGISANKFRLKVKVTKSNKEKQRSSKQS